jgi:hypothetical protein
VSAIAQIGYILLQKEFARDLIIWGRNLPHVSVEQPEVSA